MSQVYERKTNIVIVATMLLLCDLIGPVRDMIGLLLPVLS